MNPQDLFQHAQPLTPSLVHSKTIIMPADFTTVMGVVVWGGLGAVLVSLHILEMEKVIL